MDKILLLFLFLKNIFIVLMWSDWINYFFVDYDPKNLFLNKFDTIFEWRI